MNQVKKYTAYCLAGVLFMSSTVASAKEDSPSRRPNLELFAKDSHRYLETTQMLNGALHAYKDRTSDPEKLEQIKSIESKWRQVCLDIDADDEVEAQVTAQGSIIYNFSCFNEEISKNANAVKGEAERQEEVLVKKEVEQDESSTGSAEKSRLEEAQGQVQQLVRGGQGPDLTEGARATPILFEVDSKGNLVALMSGDVKAIQTSERRKKILGIVLKEVVATAGSVVASILVTRQIYPGKTNSDKVSHAVVSSLMASTFASIARHYFKFSPKKSAIIGGLLSCAVGAGKELSDKARGGKHVADSNDMGANAVGCTFGAIGIYLTF